MRYEAVWYTHDGVRKGVIQAFESLEYVKTQNAIGALVINMPRGLIQYDQFSVGDIFEGFNTLRNYTPLKPKGTIEEEIFCFNTLRNYTPLKPQILRFFGISHHKCQMWVISKRAPQIIPE